MLPDPKWLDALKLPLRVAVAVAIFSIVLLAIDLTGLLDLSPLGSFIRPLLVVLAVSFSTLSIVGIIHELFAPFRERRRQSTLSMRRAVRRKEEEERIGHRREQVLAHLDYLSKEEIRYAANCLRDGSPSFYTYIYSPAVSMLTGKGLVWTPGGAHHMDHYPYSFHDFVWKRLLDRKDEFLAKDDEYKRIEATEKKKEQQRALRGI